MCERLGCRWPDDLIRYVPVERARFESMQARAEQAEAERDRLVAGIQRLIKRFHRNLTIYDEWVIEREDLTQLLDTGKFHG